MAAVQVATTSTTIVASDPDQWRTVFVSNLGPNPIFVEVGAAATAAGSVSVAATTGLLGPIALPPNQAINAICPTALQVTPADTRVMVT
jgi:hypothetical protein